MVESDNASRGEFDDMIIIYDDGFVQHEFSCTPDKEIRDFHMG